MEKNKGKTSPDSTGTTPALRSRKMEGEGREKKRKKKQGRAGKALKIKTAARGEEIIRKNRRKGLEAVSKNRQWPRRKEKGPSWEKVYGGGGQSVQKTLV